MKIIVGLILGLIMISFVSVSVYATPMSSYLSNQNCGNVEKIKELFEVQARAINGVLPEGSTSDQIRYFAEKSFNSPFSNENLGESYLHLKYFFTETCKNKLPDGAKLNSSAQKGVDLFEKMVEKVGKADQFHQIKVKEVKTPESKKKETEIKINTNDASMWYDKGVALSNLGKYEDAIKAYDQAIKINPKNGTVWIEKGSALAHLGKMEDALKAVDQAIKINPKNDNMWYYKSIVLYNVAKYDDALKAVDQAIKINPKNDNMWHWKGAVLFKFGKYEDAIKAFDQAIKINPKNDFSWNNKGSALASLSKYDDALKAVDQAIKINPKKKDWQQNKALILELKEGTTKKQESVTTKKQESVTTKKQESVTTEKSTESVRFDVFAINPPKGWFQFTHQSSDGIGIGFRENTSSIFPLLLVMYRSPFVASMDQVIMTLHMDSQESKGCDILKEGKIKFAGKEGYFVKYDCHSWSGIIYGTTRGTDMYVVSFMTTGSLDSGFNQIKSSVDSFKFVK